MALELMKKVIPQHLTTGCFEYYKFNNSIAPFNGHTLIPSTTPVFTTVDGRSGVGNFNGNFYLEGASLISDCESATTGFTIQMYFYPLGGNSWLFGADSTPGPLFGGQYSDSGGYMDFWAGGIEGIFPAPTLNQWHSILYVGNPAGATGFKKLVYLDGGLVYNSDGSGLFGTGATTFKIGDYVSDLARFNGYFSELSFWNIPLTMYTNPIS